ncbi:hypothetical protein H6G97_41000 [Nostoc flagelliforme FACHB-838]|uniref:Uncharacterized protein n=1 Tax=Nostoc flagelliforme FACHB-838 TaxID=2692904 RepID=A0ABR8E2W7_9NOSO|nr:hypothetical protein [Nostoc flagelliforme]MBD2535437.1 hypothetical protein [Nostoc flagelliforme FACHB-838]
MFTKVQLIEWFSDRYSDVQVIEALRIMRDHGADVDPEGDEFSPDITEELEKVFELAGAAINNHLHLPASEQEASAIQQATEMAASIIPNVNHQMMAGMIRVVMSGAVAQANAIATLEAKVFQRALDHSRSAFASSFLEQTQYSTQYLRSLSDNDGQINKLLAGYGVETVDVDAFLSDVKSLTPQVKSDIQNFKLKAPADNTFSIDAFLEDMGQ